MNADGSNPRQLTRYAGSNPAWSPDGRRIAFRSRFDLFVVNVDGSGLRRLARNGSAPTWSPDGRTIAFLHNREVYIVKADGSRERRLTQLDK